MVLNPVQAVRGQWGGQKGRGTIPLNESQGAAVHGLHNAVEIVQGPPGTGKSHVNVAVAKNAMEDCSRRGQLILLTCQTNAAWEANAKKVRELMKDDVDSVTVFASPDKVSQESKQFLFQHRVGWKFDPERRSEIRKKGGDVINDVKKLSTR